MKLQISQFNPLRLSGFGMSPQILLIAKLTWIILLIEGFAHYLTEPFLPFFESLNILSSIPGYVIILKILFGACGLLLLTNVFPRVMCIILGVLVLLVNVQSEIYFRNHTTICGFVFLLGGLQGARESPIYIQWQMVIVYFGAWMNKQFDPDWWTGQFFEDWTHARLQFRAYIWAAGQLPDMWLSKFFSWASITTELVVGLGLCFRRFWKPALWLGLSFHLGTFVFMKGGTFGHFIQSLGVIYIAFLTWPKTKLEVSWEHNYLKWLRSLFVTTDFDHKINWTDSGSGIVVQWDEREEKGISAITSLLLYTPIFYWTFLILFSLFHHLLPWPLSFGLNGILVFFFFGLFGYAQLSSFRRKV